MSKFSFFLIISIISASLLQGCGAVLVGGVTTGAAVIHDRRSAGTVLDDKTIQLRVLSAIQKDSQLDKQSSIGATSYNHVLLLTGQAATAGIHDRIVELARNTPMVKRVIDEIEIGPSTSLSEESKDAFITTKVKFALLDIDLPSFDPTRVKVVTEKGVVYLLGMVTPKEASAAVEKARYISGVKRVVKIFEYI